VHTGTWEADQGGWVSSWFPSQGEVCIMISCCHTAGGGVGVHQISIMHMYLSVRWVCWRIIHELVGCESIHTWVSAEAWVSTAGSVAFSGMTGEAPCMSSLLLVSWLSPRMFSDGAVS
jgi:hypothetical protein